MREGEIEEVGKGKEERRGEGKEEERERRLNVPFGSARGREGVSWRANAG